MDYFLTLDWAETFAPQMTLPEALVRGTVVYFALLALMRVTPKWQAGSGNVVSLLFVVMLGGLAGDAVRGKTNSVTDLLLMIATLMLWVVVMDRLSYRSAWIRRLVQAPPTCLIRDGRILWKNLQHESLTEEDLKTQLRRQDVDDIANVREALLEADGSISVVKKDEAHPDAKPTAGTTLPTEADDQSQ